MPEGLSDDAARNRAPREGRTRSRDVATGLHRIEERDGYVQFDLACGQGIALFRRSGRAVGELREVRPPAGAVFTYRTEEETACARRGPTEQIWRVRRE
ncbi:MAG TPA: hypothetical protein VHF23_04835 [Gaiellaceae bacterium]|nr:hypothetical protein [Gaiellaceae bacterium]